MSTVESQMPERVVFEYPHDQYPVVTYPGDFGLVCDWKEDLLGSLIRAGERVWYGNTDFARWTHAFMIVGPHGEIVEANAGGVQRKNISEYANADFVVVHPTAVMDYQRMLACECAQAMVGETYGYVDYLGLVPRAIFHWNLSVHAGNAPICSELVARCSEKYISKYDWSVEEMMPASLAAYWHVRTDQPLPKLNLWDRFLNVVGSICPKW